MWHVKLYFILSLVTSSLLIILLKLKSLLKNKLLLLLLLYTSEWKQLKITETKTYNFNHSRIRFSMYIID